MNNGKKDEERKEISRKGEKMELVMKYIYACS